MKKLLKTLKNMRFAQNPIKKSLKKFLKYIIPNKLLFIFYLNKFPILKLNLKILKVKKIIKRRCL